MGKLCRSARRWNTESGRRRSACMFLRELRLAIHRRLDHLVTPHVVSFAHFFVPSAVPFFAVLPLGSGAHDLGQPREKAVPYEDCPCADFESAFSISSPRVPIHPCTAG